MRRRDLGELTDREREVLALLQRDFTNEQIAHRLGISLDGAKYHVSQILSKLGVASREEATAVALSGRRRWWASWPLWTKIAGAAMATAIAGAVVFVASSAIGSSEAEPEFLGDMTPLGPDIIGQYDDPQNFNAFAGRLSEAIETGDQQWFLENTRFTDYDCRPPIDSGFGLPPPPPPAACEGESPPATVPAIKLVPFDFEGDEADNEKSDYLLTGLYYEDTDQYTGLIQRFLNDHPEEYFDRYGAGGPKLYSYGKYAAAPSNPDLQMTAIAGSITDLSSTGNKVDDARRIAINFNASHDANRWAIDSVWFVSDRRFVVIDLDAASEQAKIETGHTEVWQFWQRWK